MSLRWRITLLTAALIAISVLLVGVGIYLVAARIQLSTVDRSLSAALTDTRVRALATRSTSAADDEEVAIGIGRVAARTGVLTVLRHAGTTAEQVPFPTLSATDLAAASVGPITVPGEPDQRVFARQARPNGALIVAATPLTALEAERARLTRGIVSSAALVALLGAVAAWLFVRRAFRPMADMVEVTGAVAAGDLTQRVAPAPAGTELGDLASAVNAMIDSLSTSITQVADAQEQLRRFVSDASHEIRTPLTVIRGYAEVLAAADVPRSEVETRALARILAESGRLERLVTQLLALERVEARASVSASADARDVIDLEPIVRDGFTDLDALGGRPLTIATVPAQVRADSDAWLQVVANLAQNVERHTPAGSPVDVRLSVDGGQVRLTVDDAGPGIPSADRSRVVERFARPAGSVAGFGLGMSIVAAVVSSTGGTLTLGDSPSGGLRVEITVPGAQTSVPSR